MDITTLENGSLLIASWVQERNQEYKVTNVKGSDIVWWSCDKGHQWQAKVYNRVKGSGCVYCSNQKVLVGYNDLAFTHPNLAKEWHPIKNGDLKPENVIAGSEKKFWWVCDKGHEWEAVLHSRAGRNIGCPVCSGNQVLVGFNDLVTTHLRIASQWHPSKNGSLTPEQVSAGSNKKVWWVCDKGHEWETPVARRTQLVNSSGCVYCCNQKVLVGFNDLVTTHPELAAQWHPTKNGILLPSGFIAGTGKKIWWLCGKGHEWQATGASRAKGIQTSCPVCSGNQVLVGFNDLATKKPELVKQWHPTKNGSLKPEKVSQGSNLRAWWICDKGHEWEASVVNRANKSSGCPHCVYHVSKAELEIHDYILSLNVGVVLQSSRSIISPLELDIYIPEKKVAIEYNGLYWHSEDQGKDKSYHFNKWKMCKDKGIQLIQIWEDDWKRNPELIKRMLEHKLGLSRQPKVFARKTEVKAISNREAEKFLVVNHLQGFRASTAYYGLFEDALGLVAVLTITLKGNVLEISRFASSASVVGGFSKLLNFAVKSYPEVVKVVSYSHNDYATGGVYSSNGFMLKHEGVPGYSYIVDGVRVHRLNFTKTKFKSNPGLKYDENLTERQLAELNDLVRIWDSGSSLWVKEIQHVLMVQKPSNGSKT